MIEVKEVRSSRDLSRFIKLPFQLYKDDPLFTAELIHDQKVHLSEKNPFFRIATIKLFMAYKNGQPAGRVATIVNPIHNSYHNENVLFFGLYEAVDELEVAQALMKRVEKEADRIGVSAIRGPMNLSTNEHCGFLFEGYNDPPILMTPYNPSYYNDQMNALGYQKCKDLFAFITDIPERLPEKVYRASRIAERSGIRVRLINPRKLVDELKIFQSIYNEAWKDNWGFVPISDDELLYMAKRLKPIIKAELNLIAEKDGEPVGFLGMMPDFNLVLRKMNGRINPCSIVKAIYYQNRIEDLRLLLLGVRPEYRIRGVDALLFREGFKGAKRYKRVECSWILEDNLPVIRLVEMIGGRKYKVFRIYQKDRV